MKLYYNSINEFCCKTDLRGKALLINGLGDEFESNLVYIIKPLFGSSYYLNYDYVLRLW